MSQQSFEDEVLVRLEKLGATFADFERKEAIIAADVRDMKTKLTFQNLTVESIKSNQKETLGRLHTLEEQHAQLHDDVSRIEVLQEVIEDKIDQLIEVISPEMEKVEGQRLHIEKQEATLKSHSLRLKAIEKSL